MLEGRKVEISTGNSFDPVPMNRYTVQCVDVNLVTQQKYQSSEEEEVLNYKFVILDEKPMEILSDDGTKEKASTRGRYLWKRCRLALSERSWLGKLAMAAEGRSLTKEEMASFDPEAIVGKQVDVMVEHKAKEDKVYVNIVTFSKAVTPLEPIKDEELKKTGQVVETATAPATAPDADKEADNLISEIKEESKQVEPTTESEDDVEVLQAQLKLAKAKAKAAKKK